MPIRNVFILYFCVLYRLTAINCFGNIVVKYMKITLAIQDDKISENKISVNLFNKNHNSYSCILLWSVLLTFFLNLLANQTKPVS